MDNTNMMVLAKEECVELASVLKKAIVSELMEIEFNIDKYTDSERIARAYDVLLRASLEEITDFIDRVESIKDDNCGYKGYITCNEHNRPELSVKKLEIIEKTKACASETPEKYYLATCDAYAFDVYGMKLYTEEELNTFYEQQKARKEYTASKGLHDEIISAIRIREITKDEYDTLVGMGLKTFGAQSIFDLFKEESIIEAR